MDSSVVLGIDIGGTNTVYGFISRDGHIYTHEEIPTRGQEPVSDLVDRIETRTHQFLKNNSELDLFGVGIGARDQ